MSQDRFPSVRTLLASRAFFPVLAIAIAVYYALLTTGRSLMLWAPATAPGESAAHTMLGFVFNDMLLRLFHGDFTISPEIIKFEAVFRDDKIYAYFGVMPALIRLVFLPFFDLTKTDISPLCVVIAATLCVLFKLAALRARRFSFSKLLFIRRRSYGRVSSPPPFWLSPSPDSWTRQVFPRGGCA